LRPTPFAHFWGWGFLLLSPRFLLHYYRQRQLSLGFFAPILHDKDIYQAQHSHFMDFLAKIGAFPTIFDRVTPPSFIMLF
jgi:hypothetical protein